MHFQKWEDTTLKILQQMLQDFKSVSDHYGALCTKGLRLGFNNFKSLLTQNQIKHSNFYDKFNVLLLISTLHVPIIF